MQDAFNMLMWLNGTEQGPNWSCHLSKPDRTPVTLRRKARVTMKFTYLEKQKVRQCRYFWKPWRWFLSPRRAQRNPPPRNVPRWWWVSRRPWPPDGRPPERKARERAIFTCPPHRPWGPSVWKDDVPPQSSHSTHCSLFCHASHWSPGKGHRWTSPFWKASWGYRCRTPCSIF